MKIAVVSTDGVNVNDHFGKATSFIIYEVKEGGLSRRAERKTAPLSVGDPNHPFDPKRFADVFNAISDCKKVYVTKIGDTPAAKLKSGGIEPVVYSGPIKDIKPHTKG